MGMAVRKSGRKQRHRPMGEINVTPFVDVMLVLLIVFMVTAPLLTVGVEVDLPKTKAGQINAEAAREFYQFLNSERAAAVIQNYQLNGKTLFTPLIP